MEPITSSMQIPNSNTHFAVYARAEDTSAEAPISMHDVIKSGNMPEGITNPRAVAKAMLDVDSWLPFASEVYNISANLRDFVVVPTTIFLTDLPNANLAAFPFDEMSSWNSQAGNVTYKTWARKPTHVEHANQDPTKAMGVIFDSSLRAVPNYLGGVYRTVLLNGWDRLHHPELCEKISAGRTGFSMGAWVSDYECSVCGHSMRQGACAHLHPQMGPKMGVVGNKLVYKIARGVTGFECSSVGQPAWRSAFGQPIG